ncbi:Hsp70 protein-domain-containing protein [Powellomyces hirtus]|nr:Hsp70 protein-domain-containing protein [Powellomyces hirtus]
MRLLTPKSLATGSLVPFLALLILALCTVAPHGSSASVIGIDFGTEWSKVALVKSGVPLDIVLNAESKRKTPAVVFVKEGDRRYGSDAVALSTRFPQDSYPALKNLLGKLYDDPIAEAYRATYTNTMVRDPVRGTCAFKFNETTTFSVEELVAMQLAYAKKQAEVAGQEFVAGAVLTVPPYWGQFERQALLDAAELASLRVLSLINDETAVALNFASGRQFPQPQYHIFYDMGAGSTVAALVKFHNPGTTKHSKTLELEVQAVGYDASLGGHSVDVKLQHHLANEFKTKFGKKLQGDVFADSRAMAKLLKEAGRVKQILSANTETASSVEGVMEDIDFRTKVTRATLEDITSDIARRVTGPVSSILTQANMTLDQLDSLILVGGGARIPFVQAALRDLVGENKIAKNVNADEAAVLGAAFRGAGLSTQFRVREIKIKDLNLHPIDIAYNAEPKDAAAAAATRTFRTTFFSDKTSLGSKKLMTFKRKSDFEFQLAYKPTNDHSPATIIRATITGLEDAIKAKRQTALDDPKVKAFIELTESGIISVGEATAHFEVEQVDKEAASLKDTVLNFFKGKKTDNKGEEDADAGVEEVDEDSDKPTTPSAETTSTKNTHKNSKTAKDTTNTTATPTPPPSKKIITETIKLNLTLTYPTLPPLTPDQLLTAKHTLSQLDTADAHRRAREEARNTLEAFYYTGKELIYDDDLDHTATEHERTTFKTVFEDVSEWIYEVADEAPLEDLVHKLKALKDVHTPLHFKVREHKMRDAAVEKLKTVTAEARVALDAWRKAITDTTLLTTNDTTDNTTTTTTDKPPAATAPRRHTASELDALHTQLVRAEEWLAEKLEQQSKLVAHAMPVLVTKDIAEYVRSVEKELRRLRQKPAPPHAKSKSTTTTTTTTTPGTHTTTRDASKTKLAATTTTTTTTFSSSATLTTSATTTPSATTSAEHEEL